VICSTYKDKQKYMTATQKLFVIPAIALAIIGGGAAAGYASLASAETNTGSPQMGMHMGMGRGHGPGGPGGHGHGVVGSVTAVDGSTVTVTGMDGKTYTVTVGAATVARVVEGTLSDIHVGDRIGVHGAVSGTTVVAERIMDDVPAPPAPKTP
jgi:hypothetical protein